MYYRSVDEAPYLFENLVIVEQFSVQVRKVGYETTYILVVGVRLLLVLRICEVTRGDTTSVIFSDAMDWVANHRQNHLAKQIPCTAILESYWRLSRLCIVQW